MRKVKEGETWTLVLERDGAGHTFKATESVGKRGMADLTFSRGDLGL